MVRQRGEKVVVLDDDPTGTQTVYETPVLTAWSEEMLRSELANELPLFYLLTNSRSVSLRRAKSLNREIGRNLVKAARRLQRKFVVVSRSDSTLRGHFPGEVEALAEGLGRKFDAWLLIPFFEEGGRYTIDDVHYVADGEWLVPAAETEFAHDAVFGYHSSDLREWVEEKTKGRILATNVSSITLEDIRLGGPKRVTKKLLSLPRGSVCIVNSASSRDLEVFTLGVLHAEAQGRRFLYRTAASFVRSRAGLGQNPILTHLPLPKGNGGLVVVGSYVPKSSVQLSTLLDRSEIEAVEVDVQRLLSNVRADEVARVIRSVDQKLSMGVNVAVFTSRHLVLGRSPIENLRIGKRISTSLVEIIRRISTRPRFLLAKGGITSSEIASEGLNVKRAMVLGQIFPGVPVWRLGPESRFPGLIYIVFPGNVGGPEALVETIKKLGNKTNDRKYAIR
jgi:uncharacterized protein YgbK (DUF1537 family)